MGFSLGFVCGLVCGVMASVAWRALRCAWARVTELEVADVELPAHKADPARALVHDGMAAYYVRQLVPGARIAWYREDTGEPVSELLEQRLGLRLALAHGARRRAQVLTALREP